jgi:cbb3-type cytochrome oxidase subunit 3
MNFTRAADNAVRGFGLPFLTEGETMVATPNTWGVVLLFVILFVACIIWATHGTTGRHDSQEEDLQAIGKPR